jgi:hypothetical protein
MFFGATSFSEVPFTTAGGGIAFAVNGVRTNISTGQVSIAAPLVAVNGSRLNSRTGSVSVITWEDVPVNPGNNWVAINPNSVVNYTNISPGASQTWTPIDPDE